MTNSKSSNRSRRIASTVAVAAAAITAFASLGGVGLAQSAIGLAQYQYGKKVTVCHKGKKTVSISVRAWPAHKRHGDTEGACVGTTEKNHAEPAGEKEHGKAQGATSSGRSDDDSGHGKGNGKSRGNGKR